MHLGRLGFPDGVEIIIKKARYSFDGRFLIRRTFVNLT
jgi:hypothetical protein